MLIQMLNAKTTTTNNRVNKNRTNQLIPYQSINTIANATANASANANANVNANTNTNEGFDTNLRHPKTDNSDTDSNTTTTTSTNTKVDADTNTVAYPGIETGISEASKGVHSF